MDSLELLDRTARAAIEADRIGKPVFVRCLVVSADDGNRFAKLTRAVETVSAWLSSTVHRLYAVRSPGPAQWTLLLEFESGSTALVSTVTSSPGGAAVDLIVLGNRGALYFDGLSRTEPVVESSGVPPVPSETPGLRKAIEEAVQSGKPITMTPKGTP